MPIPDTPAPMIATRGVLNTRDPWTPSVCPGWANMKSTVKMGSRIVIHQTANRTSRLNQ